MIHRFNLCDVCFTHDNLMCARGRNHCRSTQNIYGIWTFFWILLTVSNDLLFSFEFYLHWNVLQQYLRFAWFSFTSFNFYSSFLQLKVWVPYCSIHFDRFILRYLARWCPRDLIIGRCHDLTTPNILSLVKVFFFSDLFLFPVFSPSVISTVIF